MLINASATIKRRNARKQRGKLQESQSSGWRKPHGLLFTVSQAWEVREEWKNEFGVMEYLVECLARPLVGGDIQQLRLNIAYNNLLQPSDSHTFSSCGFLDFWTKESGHTRKGTVHTGSSCWCITEHKGSQKVLPWSFQASCLLKSDHNVTWTRPRCEFLIVDNFPQKWTWHGYLSYSDGRNYSSQAHVQCERTQNFHQLSREFELKYKECWEV